MTRHAVTGLFFALLLTACAGTPAYDNGPGDDGGFSSGGGNLPGAGGGANDPLGSLGGVELCDAPEYRPYVGQPVAATTFPTGPKFRVYSDTDVVTQEYLPDRTNVVFGARSGTILRVFCG
ncbi:hypothetical protein EF888_02230 [Silicimonas algicola]|uniref:Peptidase inhibitor I78 family protein n=1 Tax=Silicimonas algicola TaxID=1826607 RepID=A0A316GDN9_9RHOB|nr:hypothetical protein [Silicimonas algicola]AZQ66048.1 hypothetical protein EF888_02230 [Silicimonas algicola]PWK58345.1 hypothetical protein C8D95_101151 [Silicimonas algicola]